jgi:hypothetical protein
VRDLAFAVVLVALASCAGCSGAPPHPDPEAVVRVGNLTFTGPWAADFADLYQHTEDEEVRRALRDGVITAGEYVFFEHSIEGCLEQVGVRGRFSDGQWLYERPDEVPDEEVDRCLRSNGAAVMALRDAVVQNPAHVDEGESMARCLVREGAVPPTYDAQDYARELESGSYSFDIESDAFSNCLEAPAGGRRR